MRFVLKVDMGDTAFDGKAGAELGGSCVLGREPAPLRTPGTCVVINGEPTNIANAAEEAGHFRIQLGVAAGTSERATTGRTGRRRLDRAAHLPARGTSQD